MVDFDLLANRSEFIKKLENEDQLLLKNKLHTFKTIQYDRIQETRVILIDQESGRWVAYGLEEFCKWLEK